VRGEFARAPEASDSLRAELAAAGFALPPFAAVSSDAFRAESISDRTVASRAHPEAGAVLEPLIARQVRAAAGGLHRRRVVLQPAPGVPNSGLRCTQSSARAIGGVDFVFASRTLLEHEAASGLI
jgi:hypothetical protein